MTILQDRMHDQMGMMQNLWDQLLDKLKFLHEQAHQEHGWVEEQMTSLRTLMENNHTPLVAQLEGFT